MRVAPPGGAAEGEWTIGCATFSRYEDGEALPGRHRVRVQAGRPPPHPLVQHGRRGYSLPIASAKFSATVKAARGELRER